MKKKLKFNVIALPLVLLLLFSSLPLSEVSAHKSIKEVNTENIVVDGKSYEYKATKEGSTFTVKVAGEDGYIKLTRNGDKVSKVESDFLNENDKLQVKEQTDSLIQNIKEDKSISHTSNDAVITNFMAAKSKPKWRNGKWQKFSVTANGKATAQIIITTLGGALGSIVGSIAGSLAAIILQHKLKVGYFKYRYETKVDFSKSVYYQRVRVKTYKDKARKKHIGTRVTKTRTFPLSDY